ncbi:hypothetical protein KC332_g6250 [Hortaea werneckii]|nr:hypothetical protein KC366_g5710 [Hortaea werneckii]KAI7131982.1 hypothetical protein KC337_g5756 [Hortaea werneckii]KAI7264155.1 hypothetical protein KC335_g9430 [Hortaea werneckii]KAI7410718.1 hypothetical protein KC332_g6250 [Hortaea werneckii]KAI7447354.1 hypothetical protein KC364_g12761 [Hortaea werneckii]
MAHNWGMHIAPNLGRQFEDSYEFGISLDPLVGNSNGTFSTAEQNYSASARNVHLRNTTLHAELRTVNGQWKRDEIDLRLLVRSTGDGLQPADPRRALRVAPPRNTKMAALHAKEPRDRLYMPLKNDTDLRMCYIKPGGFGDEVKCNLVTRQAEDLQEYLCLSYVWGDVGDPATIQVNTQKKPVTRNLHMAMRRLRAHGYHGALWIDALCINQADIEEKSIQVSRMSSTYAKAQRVFVWLDSFEHSATDQLGYSPSAATVATFFGLLASNAHMTEAIKQSVSNSSQPTANSSVDASWEEQAPIDYLVRALRTFVSSRWFERTWTIQEFVLSRELVYAFGDELLDTKTVKSALKRMECHFRTCCKTALYGMSETARLLLESVLTDLQNVFTAQDGIRKLSEGARKKTKYEFDIHERDSIWSARNPSVEGSLSLISSLDQLLDGTFRSPTEVSKHLKFPGATLLYPLAYSADSIFSRLLQQRENNIPGLDLRRQGDYSGSKGTVKGSAEEADRSTWNEKPTPAAVHSSTHGPSSRGIASVVPALGQLTQSLRKSSLLKSKAQCTSSTHNDDGSSVGPEFQDRQATSNTTPDSVRLQASEEHSKQHAAQGYRSNLMHLASQFIGNKKPGAHTTHPAVDCSLRLLSQCRVKQCSDPRDRVFAFMDIATQAFGAFKADYAMSVEDLYKTFTLRIIDQVGNLDIWSLRQPYAEPELSGRPELPSWAIDWACADFSVQSCYDLQSELLKPMFPLSLSPKIYNLRGDDVLSVYGTKVDVVQAMTTRPWAPCKRGLSGVHVSGESELGDWLQFLGIRTAERNPDKDVLWDSFYALLTAKQASKYTVDTYHGSLPGSSPGHSWREATQADRELFSAWAAREQQHDPALPTPMPDELLPIRRLVDTFAGAKSLFRTGGGLIGLCPPWTKPGDELYCLSGYYLTFATTQNLNLP